MYTKKKHNKIKVNNHTDDKILIIFALHNNINGTVKLILLLMLLLFQLFYI